MEPFEGCNCSRNMPYLDWSHDKTCPLYRPLIENTPKPTKEEEQVKLKFPDAQCQWTSRGWRVWTGNIDDGIVELGRTTSPHVPQSEAWADAAKKMESL